MNQYQEFKKSQADKIRACYESTDLEKGGEGSRGGTIIGHTQSGKPIYKQNGFNVKHQDFTAQDHLDAVKVNKEVAAKHRDQSKKLSSHMSGKVAGDEAELHDQFASEHQEQAEKKGLHKEGDKVKVERHSGVYTKATITNVTDKQYHYETEEGDSGALPHDSDKISKSEVNDLEKGGIGSGKYLHLKGHQFVHQRQRHTVKKIDDAGVVHTQDGKMFRMSTLQDNGVEFPEKQPTVRAPRPLDMNDYKNKLAELEQEKDTIFAEQDSDPDIEPEGGPVANMYGGKLMRVDKKIAELQKKFDINTDSDEHIPYEEVQRRSRLITEENDKKYGPPNY